MELKELAGPEEIMCLIGRLASRIDQDYIGARPVMVGVLNGSFVFMADLVRMLKTDAEVDFIRARSYGLGQVSSGEVLITKDVEIDVCGRDVILVEDILDTGRTAKALSEHILAKGPASLKICVLLDKPSKRVVDYHADYVGMEVEDRFIVGYGLDCAERFRNLPGLYELLDIGAGGG